MGKIISLKQYREEKMNAVKGVKWDHESFYLNTMNDDKDIYFDRALYPMFESNETVYSLRDEIVSCFPKLDDMRNFKPFPTKMFMPFAFDLDPVLYLGVDSVSCNHYYPPLTVMYNVIRDYHKKFEQRVHGKVVSNNDEYLEVREKFNTLYKRVLHDSHTKKKMATETVFVELGSLFYILLKTADMSQGILADSLGGFTNDWNNHPTAFNMGKELYHYKAKLSSCHFCGLPWVEYANTHLEQTCDETIWLVNVPDFENEKPEVFQSDFDRQDFVYLMDLFTHKVASLGGIVLYTIPMSNELHDFAMNAFNFRLASGGVWKNRLGYLKKTYTKSSGYNNFYIFTNYSPTIGDSKRFVV